MSTTNQQTDTKSNVIWWLLFNVIAFGVQIATYAFHDYPHIVAIYIVSAVLLIASNREGYKGYKDAKAGGSDLFTVILGIAFAVACGLLPLIIFDAAVR